jgi:hypothetical protein
MWQMCALILVVSGHPVLCLIICICGILFEVYRVD